MDYVICSVHKAVQMTTTSMHCLFQIMEVRQKRRGSESHGGYYYEAEKYNKKIEIDYRAIM